MKISTKTLIALAALILTFPALKAQNSVTPYSMYGYGMLNDRATSMQRQMGGVGIAQTGGRQINAMNPASYASIDSLTFLFDMGADVSMLWSKEDDKSERKTGGGLDYLAMQFPFSRHMGGSIGLIPYSSVGYAFGSDIVHGTRQNQGTGGINQAYAGVAGQWFGLSIGANFCYNFGTITNALYAVPQNETSSLFEHVMQIRDFDITLGLQYSKRWNRTNRATIGFIYSPKMSMHGTTWATFQNITSSTTKADTVGLQHMGGRYYRPNTFGVGLSYSHDRTSHFMVEADFLYQDWSKAKYEPLLDADGKVLFEGMNFNNRWRVGLGAEYTPKTRGSYLKKITYRIGAYYVNDYLQIHGNKVKEYGVSCGFGFPTPEGKTLINLGLEYKHRQASPQKLVSENYFNITLGVNFNEIWFWKRKIR
ncbi:putative uncharacterized protein [Prevotella sp. CAG:485]|nr:putative uncharacterized protein [Prevotella sp. CAG:485]